MWERAPYWQGPWLPMDRVPVSVIRRFNKRVRRGLRDDLIIPAAKFYWRFVFCV